MPCTPGLQRRLSRSDHSECGRELTGVAPGAARYWREELIDDQPDVQRVHPHYLLRLGIRRVAARSALVERHDRERYTASSWA